MDVKQLRYFVQVADSGGFTAASLTMDIGQPAISKQIRLLEAEVGAQLFLRHGRGIVVTPAGRHLLEHARDVVERIENVKAEMSELSKTVAGEITCGLPASIGSTLTTPLLKRFLDAFPLVRLNVVEGLSGHLYEWLLRGDLDLAAIYAPSVNNELFSELITSDEVYFVSSASDAIGQETIDFDRVVEFPLILPGGLHRGNQEPCHAGLRACAHAHKPDPQGTAGGVLVLRADREANPYPGPAACNVSAHAQHAPDPRAAVRNQEADLAISQ
jgi:LysR family transcriptional regulator, nitrogen assimilation regulatory protein